MKTNLQMKVEEKGVKEKGVKEKGGYEYETII